MSTQLRNGIKAIVLLVSILCTQISVLYSQGVAINNTNSAPDASAMLDVQSTDKGILIPRLTAAQRTAISAPATGLLVFDSDSLSFYFFNGSGWISLGTSSSQIGEIVDADGDTKVQVEESTDEDMIRFDIAGTEFIRLENRTINVINSGSSVFIGADAGENDDHTANRNVYIGQNSGETGTTASYNTAVGYQALRLNETNNQNTALGYETLENLVSGASNTALGKDAMRDSDTASNNTAVGLGSMRELSNGNNNVAVGRYSGQFVGAGSLNVFIGSESGQNNTGNQNVMLGFRSGENNTGGSGNVFIGDQSGQNSIGSDQLYIENSNSTTPLIYGDFANDTVMINGTFGINHTYHFPASAGTNGQVLVTDNSGNVSWADQTTDTDDQTLSLSNDTLSIADGNSISLAAYLDDTDTDDQTLSISEYTLTISEGNSVTLPSDTIQSFIEDTDSDTKIQVEESADEDHIRFDVAGNEALVIDNDGLLGIGTSTPEAMVDINLSGSATNAAHLQLKSTNGNGFALLTIDRYTTNDNGYVIFKTNDVSDWYVGEMTTDDDFEISRSAAGDATFHIEEGDGKIGMGISAPEAPLHVHESAGNGVLITRDDATTVADEQLGGIGFDSDDGNFPTTLLQSSASIIAYAGEAHGTGDKGGYLTFNTSPNNQDDNTDGLERMRIANSGQVQIFYDSEWFDGGTSNNQIAELQDDGDDGRFMLYEDGVISIDLQPNSTTVFNQQGFDRDFRIESDNNENVFRVDAANDRVGIGTGTPDYDLQVENTNPIIGLNDLEISDMGSNNLGLDGDVVPYNSTAGFDLGNNTAGENWDDVVANGFVTFSDKNLKQNIDTLKPGLKEIMALRPVSYQYKKTHDPAERNRYGLIAQEVQQVIPQLVLTEDVDVNPETGELEYKESSHLSMNYMELIPVLINGMQEQQALIEQLQAEIEALKAQHANESK